MPLAASLGAFRAFFRVAARLGRFLAPAGVVCPPCRKMAVAGRQDRAGLGRAPRAAACPGRPLL